MFRKILFLFFSVIFSFAANANFEKIEVVDADLQKAVMKESGISKKDISIYKDIFAAIRDNEIEKADSLTAKLKSNALMGHVLAQKYLSAKYISNYKELQGWLKKYSGLPQQRSIANLAKVKAPGYKAPKRQPQKKIIYAPYGWFKEKYDNLKPADRRFVREQLLEFLRAIRRSDNEKALKIMEDKRFRMTIPDKFYDGMSGTLVTSYFYEGEYENALKWSEKPVRRSHEPTAAWFGAMAAWKMQNYKKAAELFEKLVSFNNEDQWLTASGAFWAYRANLKLGNKDKANEYLRMAANKERTFYGILARKFLGKEPKYTADPAAYFNNFDEDDYRQEIVKSEALRRAILLLMAEEYDLAEDDLRKNYPNFSMKQKELVMFLGRQYSLANLTFLLANGMKNYKKHRSYDGFFYPYPDWKPKDGWKINKSLIWALVRQESLFAHKIRSFAGACGLMQVMPNTAANVTKNKEYKKGCKLLFDRKNNLRIGQNYVDILQQDEEIGKNLFFIAASYNAGPHSVKKWKNRNNYDNDPLMFAEMIPWRETRLYVKKVVANYWMYNYLRGKPSQSLQQLKDGKWPMLD